MIRTQIYLPEDLYREIDIAATKEKKPKAHIIRDALKKGLAKKRQETIGEAFLRLSKLGKELNARGPKDLSVNHDKYLYEEYE